MTDPAITPARLRELALKCDQRADAFVSKARVVTFPSATFDDFLSSAQEERETAAALRAAADQLEEAHAGNKQLSDMLSSLDDVLAKQDATLAARDALLRRAWSMAMALDVRLYKGNEHVDFFTIKHPRADIEHARALAAEIAAALNEEKDNG